MKVPPSSSSSWLSSISQSGCYISSPSLSQPALLSVALKGWHGDIKRRLCVLVLERERERGGWWRGGVVSLICIGDLNASQLLHGGNGSSGLIISSRFTSSTPSPRAVGAELRARCECRLSLERHLALNVFVEPEWIHTWSDKVPKQDQNLLYLRSRTDNYEFTWSTKYINQSIDFSMNHGCVYNLDVNDSAFQHHEQRRVCAPLTAQIKAAHNKTPDWPSNPHHPHRLCTGATKYASHLT